MWVLGATYGSYHRLSGGLVLQYGSTQSMGAGPEYSSEYSGPPIGPADGRRYYH